MGDGIRSSFRLLSYEFELRSFDVVPQTENLPIGTEAVVE